ncbi:hypothetical protein [Aurantiacibacter zhengii]|nr:hypothetical protein [Aurantiacibacter zhengii]
MILSRIIAMSVAVLFATTFATTAKAECDPSFVDGDNTIRLIPPPSFSSDQLNETFQVRIRNAGDEPCLLRLGVGRRIADGSQQFPTYSLTGPDGNVPLSSLSGAPDTGSFGTEFVAPPGEQVVIAYEIRMDVGWGSEAGIFTEDLVFQLFDDRPGHPPIIRDARLMLEIPKMALIRFAGVSGIDGPALIEMGAISPHSVTQSPPFALRILSTSGYRMELVSDNGGALRRVNGPDLIPYELSLRGQRLELDGTSDGIEVNRHTSSLGDVHPVTVIIQPNPEYHAGDYSDRVFITVTAM